MSYGVALWLSCSVFVGVVGLTVCAYGVWQELKKISAALGEWKAR